MVFSSSVYLAALSGIPDFQIILWYLFDFLWISILKFVYWSVFLLSVANLLF